MKWLSRFPVRPAVFVATAHFLLYYAVMGAYLLAGHDSAALLPLLNTLGILDRPAEILTPLIERFGWFFPPSAAIPVAFASVVWSLAACLLWFLLRRFVHWNPSALSLRYTRRVAFIIACFLLSWLFFGPLSGLGGDLDFGILDIARWFPGEFSYSPLGIVISISLWALSIFAAYKFIFMPRRDVSPATA
jgi:hypothetical protein